MAPIISLLLSSFLALFFIIPIMVMVGSILHYYLPYLGRGLAYIPSTGRWYDIRLNSIWLAFVGALVALIAAVLIPLTMLVDHRRIPPHLRAQTSSPAAMNTYITLGGMAFALSPIATIYLWMDYEEGSRQDRWANATAVCDWGRNTTVCSWPPPSTNFPTPFSPRGAASEMPPEAWSCHVGKTLALHAGNLPAATKLMRLCRYSRALRVLYLILTLILAGLLIRSLLITFKKERGKETRGGPSGKEHGQIPMTQSQGLAP